MCDRGIGLHIKEKCDTKCNSQMRDMAKEHRAKLMALEENCAGDTPTYGEAMNPLYAGEFPDVQVTRESI